MPKKGNNSYSGVGTPALLPKNNQLCRFTDVSQIHFEMNLIYTIS